MFRSKSRLSNPNFQIANNLPENDRRLLMRFIMAYRASRRALHSMNIAENSLNNFNQIFDVVEGVILENNNLVLFDAVANFLKIERQFRYEDWIVEMVTIAIRSDNLVLARHMCSKPNLDNEIQAISQVIFESHLTDNVKIILIKDLYAHSNPKNLNKIYPSPLYHLMGMVCTRDGAINANWYDVFASVCINQPIFTQMLLDPDVSPSSPFSIFKDRKFHRFITSSHSNPFLKRDHYRLLTDAQFEKVCGVLEIIQSRYQAELIYQSLAASSAKQSLAILSTELANTGSRLFSLPVDIRELVKHYVGDATQSYRV